MSSAPPPPPGPPPPYAPEPYQPYEQQPPPKRNTGVILLVVGACAVALGLIATALVLTLGAGDGPVRPARPLLIQRVTAVSPGGCPAGGGTGAPSADGKTCYELEPGLTISEFAKVDVVAPDNGVGWTIDLTLQPADRDAFGRLTTLVYRLPEPRNQLAILIDGAVISAPAVQEPITGGHVRIAGPFSKDEAHRLADQLAGRS